MLLISNAFWTRDKETEKRENDSERHKISSQQREWERNSMNLQWLRNSSIKPAPTRAARAKQRMRRAVICLPTAKPHPTVCQPMGGWAAPGLAAAALINRQMRQHEQLSSNPLILAKAHPSGERRCRSLHREGAICSALVSSALRFHFLRSNANEGVWIGIFWWVLASVECTVKEKNIPAELLTQWPRLISGR